MKFLLGAATAAHQVEGNNKKSDFWAMENMKYSDFDEPSLDAVDHYHHFKEDIDLLKKAGLNAYRFSVEWARIEPVEGEFDMEEVKHYNEVIDYCIEQGIEPVITLHHFTSPVWVITNGGWEDERVIASFEKYVKFVISQFGEKLHYVCTINEANMGVQIAAIMKRIMKQMGLQVGLNSPFQNGQPEKQEEVANVFHLPVGVVPNTFLSPKTEKGDDIIMRAHQAAVKAIKAQYPDIKVGVTLSLHDVQVIDDSPEAAQQAEKEWDAEFKHYIPYIKNDDFLGVQNYTRSLISANGQEVAPKDSKLTQMGYEVYPEALEHVIRTVAKDFHQEILVTENGIGTSDDEQRQEFIRVATEGVKRCIQDGIPVKAYFHWSLLDNFEWHKGFSKTFGLIAVDRKTQKRYPKESLTLLGKVGSKLFDM